MSNKLCGSNSKCFVQLSNFHCFALTSNMAIQAVVSNHPLTVYLINYAAATATLHPVQQLPLCGINLQFSHSSTILSNHLYLINYAAATAIRPATWSRSRCPLEVMRLPPLGSFSMMSSLSNCLRQSLAMEPLLFAK